jgi:hypothetical protein
MIRFASVRLVTNDFDRLVGFYAKLAGIEPTRLAPEFAEIRMPGAVLAISTERLIVQFNNGAAIAAANRSAILELEVDDVEATHARLTDIETVQAPTTMPWGNRSLLVRDPDGNLVNIFSRPGVQACSTVTQP